MRFSAQSVQSTLDHGFILELWFETALKSNPLDSISRHSISSYILIYQGKYSFPDDRMSEVPDRAQIYCLFQSNTRSTRNQEKKICRTLNRKGSEWSWQVSLNLVKPPRENNLGPYE